MLIIISSFSFLMSMSKNDSSLKLYSIVYFILGCRFWSMLCKSIMFPCIKFQHMKPSSKYLFHDLVNSFFIFSSYFFYSSSSSSSCHAGSTDIPYPLSPLLPIVHRPRQVFRTTSRILT